MATVDVLIEMAEGAAPAGAADLDGRAEEVVQRLLHAVRKHLGLDVAFIGSVDEQERRVEFVDAAPGSADRLCAGASDPLAETYCGQILAGRLPRFLLDSTRHPVSAGIAATNELPVGTHVGVPIERPDGSTYGTLCCFAHDIRTGLDPTAVGALSMVAELASNYLERLEREDMERRQREETIIAVLDDPTMLQVVYQPLVSIETLEVVGLEALSRFPTLGRSPGVLYAEAASCGLGVELELVAVRAALADLERIPAPIRLNVNVSPDTLYTDVLREAIGGVPLDRLVVEVTEHAVIHDYTQMREASRWLRDQGVSLAVDDVGMGFSGLNRILETAPQEIKLDAAVIRDVNTNPVKQALVEALCSFGRRAGFDIVAEGIETDDEYETLRELGAPIGQGFYLWRPAPLDVVLEAL